MVEPQISFEEQLYEVALIMDQWQVAPHEWWCIGEVALKLGGYEMPWEMPAIDIAVLTEKLDWQSGNTGERSMLPPAGSMEFETYMRGVTKIGKGIEVFSAKEIPSQLVSTTVRGREIWYLAPEAQVEFYIHSITRAKQKEDFFTKHKNRWQLRLDTIWKTAIERNEKSVAEIAERLIKELNK